MAILKFRDKFERSKNAPRQQITKTFGKKLQDLVIKNVGRTLFHDIHSLETLTKK